MKKILLAFAVGAILWLVDLPLTVPAHRLAAIFAFTAVLWVTEAVPLGASALFGMSLCAFAGVADVKTVYAPFADPVMIMMLGSFMLANALSACGLDLKLALAAADAPGIRGNVWRLFIALTFVTAFISAWITNTATTAMMIPIAIGVVTRLQGPESAKQRYAAALLLMTAYASTAGGVSTKIGTGTNMIGIASIQAIMGKELNFIEWAAFGTPISLLQIGILLVLFRLYAGREAGELALEAGTVGPGNDRWTDEQRWTGAGFALAIALWVGPSVLQQILGKEHHVAERLASHTPEAAVPFFVLGLLVIIRSKGKPILAWEKAMAVDWNALLLFAGGVSLGALAFKTGLAKSVGDGLITLTGTTSLWGLTAAFTAIAILVSELSSNVATAAMLVPVAIASATSAGVSPLAPALAVTIASSLGCMMPISTPPNALAYGTGRVPLRAMLRLGLAFDILGFVTVFGGLRLILPWLGLA